MPSSPLGSTHNGMKGEACHCRCWAADTVERRRAWHDITSLGQYTRSDYVGCPMTSPPLDSIHGRMTLGMTCNHRLWAAQTVKRHWAWHAIIAHGLQIRLNDVRSDISSPPLDNTYGRSTLGRACHHRLWAAHTVERRRAWHDISRLWTAHYHDPPDTQADRDPSRQPAACARGQTAQNA